MPGICTSRNTRSGFNLSITSIAPKDDGGTIVLTVKRFNTMIFFEVKDDGLGSNAKKVMDGSSSGVGIKNTDQRLKSIFGAGSGLRVRSNEWGYSVSFFIPYEEEAVHAPEEVREEMKTKAQADLGEAMSKLEEQFGLALEVYDEFGGELLKDVEAVRRRARRGSGKASASRPAPAVPTPMSNRGVRSTPKTAKNTTRTRT